jgi:hypothetical protein
MSEMPKKPDDGESTLENGAPPAWQPVVAPPSARPLPPPPAGAAGQSGYRPVYDPGAPASGAYGVPGYGGQQAGYPPPGYSQQGYPPPNYPPAGYSPQGYPPPGYGYPQNNYSQPNTADMLSAAVLIPRWRRRRHLIFWPVFFVFVVVMVLLHGCVSLLRMF